MDAATAGRDQAALAEAMLREGDAAALAGQHKAARDAAEAAMAEATILREKEAAAFVMKSRHWATQLTCCAELAALLRLCIPLENHNVGTLVSHLCKHALRMQWVVSIQCPLRGASLSPQAAFPIF